MLSDFSRILPASLSSDICVRAMLSTILIRSNTCGIFYAVNCPLALYLALQDVSFVEDIQMFGYGGLGSLESGENLADASLASRQIFQQLKPGGIG